MYSRHFRKCSLIIASLFACTFAYAESAPAPVSCPSVSAIQQIAFKLNFAERYNDYFTVATSSFAFYQNDLPWYVGINNIHASSKEDAIAKGRLGIKNIGFRNKDFADQLGNLYICTYGPGEVVAVGGNLVTTDLSHAIKR